MYADKITDSMRLAIDETEREQRYRKLIIKNTASHRRRFRRSGCGDYQYFQGNCAGRASLREKSGIHEPERVGEALGESGQEDEEGGCRAEL